MPIDVGEGFLEYAKEHDFDVVSQAAEVLRDAYIGPYAAAGRESFHKPSRGRSQPQLLEQGRMEQVRHGANFRDAGLGGAGSVFDLKCRGRRQVRPGFKGFERHGNGGEILAYPVVKFAGDAAPLLIL